MKRKCDLKLIEHHQILLHPTTFVIHAFDARIVDSATIGWEKEERFFSGIRDMTETTAIMSRG